MPLPIVVSPPSSSALDHAPDDSFLGMEVTLRVRATGKAMCTYYVVMGCTTLSTELDYEDAAWRLAVRDRYVTALSRHAYLFDLERGTGAGEEVLPQVSDNLPAGREARSEKSIKSMI